MPEAFITLEEAAAFEGISYETMQKRVKRNPREFKAKAQPREGGGKDQILIAVSSLSATARRAWKATEKVGGRDVIIEQRANATPWYVEADLNEFVEGRKQAFYEAVELGSRIQELISYSGPDKTGYTERCAVSLGVSAPTL